MIKTKVYVGLDTATVSGIAMWSPILHVGLVLQTKGTPTELLLCISELVLSKLNENIEPIFVLERQHNFLNANTARSLLERLGYIKYSLLSIGYTVHEAGTAEVRSFLKCKTKEETFRFFHPIYRGNALTDNHTDALALALYQADQDGYVFDKKIATVHDMFGKEMHYERLW